MTVAEIAHFEIITIPIILTL